MDYRFTNSFNNNYTRQNRVPILSSVIIRTPYYVVVSDTLFYDFKISLEFQQFSPYVTIPMSNFSFSSAQCLSSLFASKRFRLSPWYNFDPKFSGKFSWLYICYIIQRNYTRIQFRIQNWLTPKVLSIIQLNQFTIYPMMSSWDHGNWFSYIRYPVIGTLFSPCLESNLERSFKGVRRWPFEKFYPNLLFKIFNLHKLKKRKYIYADAIVEADLATYALKRRSIWVQILRLLSRKRSFISQTYTNMRRTRMKFVFKKFIFYSPAAWRKKKRQEQDFRLRNKNGGSLKKVYHPGVTLTKLVYRKRVMSVYNRLSNRLRRFRSFMIYVNRKQKRNSRGNKNNRQVRTYLLPVKRKGSFQMRNKNNRQVRTYLLPVKRKGSFQMRNKNNRQVRTYLLPVKRKGSFHMRNKRKRVLDTYLTRTRFMRSESYILRGARLGYLKRNYKDIFMLKAAFMLLYMQFLNLLNFSSQYFTRFPQYTDFISRTPWAQRRFYKFFNYLVDWSFVGKVLKMWSGKTLASTRSSYFIDFSATVKRVIKQIGFQFSSGLFAISSFYTKFRKFKNFSLKYYSQNLIISKYTFIKFFIQKLQQYELNLAQLYGVEAGFQFYFVKIRFDLVYNYLADTRIFATVPKLNYLIDRNSRISYLNVFFKPEPCFPKPVIRFRKFSRVFSARLNTWASKFVTSYRVR